MILVLLVASSAWTACTSPARPRPPASGAESRVERDGGRDADDSSQEPEEIGEVQGPVSGDAEATKTFAPGVRINWNLRRVEIAAEVALREGPLELLLCGVNTREHESVFVTKARPLHVFQAMGLLGLEPGLPPRYDRAADRTLPASGESVDIRIACKDAAHAESSGPEEFLRLTSDREPPPPIRWVFAGSRFLADGRFAADDDGSIACVVDFDSALISVDASHSSDNEVLWLEANTEAIPPRGTACTVLISASP